MKLYLNRQWRNTSYGGGNAFVKGFYQYFEKTKSQEICMPNDSQAKPDVILIAGLDNDGTGISIDQAIMYKMQMNPRVKIVLRVNENDARKGTSDMDDKLVKISEHVNASIFVSTWLQAYFMKRGWKCKNNTVIHNGVDKEVFKPGEKFDNGKINIVTHHWSDNFRKGFDIYEKIDEFVKYNKDYTFTYIGRHRGTFSNSTTVIQPIHGKKLGEELGRYDVYISGSRWDPGPNHVSESIACGLPTYVHEDGGGAVEFAGLSHSYEDWEELEKILLDKKFSLNSTEFSDWDVCIKKYEDFLVTV